MKKILTAKGVILLVFTFFAFLNLFWFSVTKFQYNEFLEAVPKSKFGSHIMNKDGFAYIVKSPDYLHYEGNLGITHPNKETSLIIWPNLIGEDEYGFRLQQNGEAYELMLNSKLEPIDDSEFTKELIETNREVIDEMMERAKSVFPL